MAVVWIGSRYFESLGVQVQRGRGFTAVDGMPGHDAAIVNQRFADTYFANADPLGQRIRLSQDKTDPRRRSGSRLSASRLPSGKLWRRARDRQSTCRSGLMLEPVRRILAGRVAEPAALAPLLRRTVASLDDSVTLHNVRPLNELLADSRLQPRLIGTVLSAFAVIACCCRWLVCTR